MFLETIILQKNLQKKYPPTDGSRVQLEIENGFLVLNRAAPLVDGVDMKSTRKGSPSLNKSAAALYVLVTLTSADPRLTTQ